MAGRNKTLSEILKPKLERITQESIDEMLDELDQELVRQYMKNLKDFINELDSPVAKK